MEQPDITAKLENVAAALAYARDRLDNSDENSARDQIKDAETETREIAMMVVGSDAMQIRAAMHYGQIAEQARAEQVRERVSITEEIAAMGSTEVAADLRDGVATNVVAERVVEVYPDGEKRSTLLALLQRLGEIECGKESAS